MKKNKNIKTVPLDQIKSEKSPADFLGSYTGVPVDDPNPTQDADDL